MASFASMGEVAVGFPDDEVTAELMASRLRAEGVFARIDRGLHGSWQVPARGQLTVLVDDRDRGRARDILGLVRHSEPRTDRAALLWALLMAGSLVFGIIALVANLLGVGR